MEETGCFLGLFFGLIIGFFAYCHMVAVDYFEFKSPEPINSELEISVTNGVADTIYVYKRPIK